MYIFIIVLNPHFKKATYSFESLIKPVVIHSNDQIIIFLQQRFGFLQSDYCLPTAFLQTVHHFFKLKQEIKQYLKKIL